ncbi:MAG TPA: hypothetical protein PK280_05480 [Planctomycetota bacterium]|nr:hypothetical protein [Planctomycetota bacterium]
MMKRLIKNTLLGLSVGSLAAALIFTGCKGKDQPPAKGTAPTAPAKPDAKAAEKEKLAKAEKSFKDAAKAADAELAKKPSNYDGAIKAYTDAKAALAGTPFEKKAADEVADLTKARDKAAAAAKADAAKAAEKAKLAKAEEAFNKADAAWGKNPKDFDGALKLLADAKPLVAGTAFDKKVADLTAEVTKAKDKAAADAKTDAAKAEEKAKLAKAEEAFNKADAAWGKNPKDFDGALKLLADAKPLVAGTAFDKKVADLTAEVTKAKDKAAADAKTTADKAKLDKAAAAFKSAGKLAGAALDKKPKDFDGAVKAYTDVKADVAGTAFEKKVADELVALDKAKAEAAKQPVAKVEPPKPAAPKVKAVTDFLAKPAEDVKSAEEAWAKAGELEKAADKPERERLTAALPYYLAVIKKDADGKFDINSPAAARRVAEIVDKYADNAGERLSAAKYYYVAANLDLGSDVWEKAEKGFVKAGKGAAFAQLLKVLSQNAAARATELYASADGDDKAQAAKLQKFSTEVGKRADALAAKYSAAKG